MRIVINLGILLGIVLAVLFTVPIKDGEPFLTRDKVMLWMENPEKASSRLKEDLGVEPEAAEVYRWQDAQGNWHFADSGSEQAEKINVKPAQTVRSEKFVSDPALEEKLQAEAGPQDEK